MAVTLYVPAGIAAAGVYVHVVPLMVAAPLMPLTVIVKDALEPTVPVKVGGILSVVVVLLTVGTELAVTVNSFVVVSVRLP